MANEGGPSISIEVQFSGGLELLFSSKANHSLSIPRYYNPDSISSTVVAPSTPPKAGKETDLKYLIYHLRHFLLDDTSRPELFVVGETIRPGILVLINSTDWELEGELEYVLQDEDEVVFISTLHGG
ncbi:ubiquitin related modifier 1 [Meredithblackwellia eburnea MCA 4105]